MFAARGVITVEKQQRLLIVYSNIFYAGLLPSLFVLICAKICNRKKKLRHLTETDQYTR